MKNDLPALIGALLAVAFVIAAVTGYILNIVSLLGMEQVANGEGILRVIGLIVLPLGSIMGLFV